MSPRCCFAFAASLALCAAACLPSASLDEGATQPQAVIVEAETLPPAAIAGEVVVRENAWFFAHPDSEIRFRVTALEQVEQFEALRFEVVGEHGEWIELESAPPSSRSEGACVDGDWDLHLYGLRVFVQRDELVAISTRAVGVSFDDQTSIALRPGTPIGPAREDGWRLISTSEARFFMPIPRDAIGLSFSEHGPPRASEGDVELDHGDRLEFAGHERLEFDTYGDIVATRLAPVDGQPRLEIDTPCFSAVVRAAAERGGGGSGSGMLGLVGTGGGPNREIAAGATVYWTDGSQAGRLRESQVLYDEPREHGSLRCLEREFGFRGPSEQRTLELCFDAAAVTVRESP